MGHHHHHGCGHQEKLHYTRRELLGRLGGGIAGLAFADLLLQNGLGAVSLDPASSLEQARNPLAPRPAPLPAKAKAVISIFCYGGVSHIDTFDPKPDLMKWQGETMKGVGEVRTVMGNPGGLMPSPFTFKKYGQDRKSTRLNSSHSQIS